MEQFCGRALEVLIDGSMGASPLHESLLIGYSRQVFRYSVA